MKAGQDTWGCSVWRRDGTREELKGGGAYRKKGTKKKMRTKFLVGPFVIG